MAKPNQAAIAATIEPGRHLVPPHMWSGISKYLIHGYPTGQFLQALLSNDLMEAFSRADDINIANMHRWCQFLYCFAPIGSYGSGENVSAWLTQFVVPA